MAICNLMTNVDDKYKLVQLNGIGSLIRLTNNDFDIASFEIVETHLCCFFCYFVSLDGYPEKGFYGRGWRRQMDWFSFLDFGSAPAPASRGGLPLYYGHVIGIGVGLF